MAANRHPGSRFLIRLGDVYSQTDGGGQVFFMVWFFQEKGARSLNLLAGLYKME